MKEPDKSFPLQVLSCCTAAEQKEVFLAYEEAQNLHPYGIDVELEYKKYTPKQLLQLYKSQFDVSAKSVTSDNHIVINSFIRHPRNEQIKIERGEDFDLDTPDDFGAVLFFYNSFFSFFRSHSGITTKERTPFSVDSLIQILLLSCLCGAYSCPTMENFYLHKYLKLKFMIPGIPDPKYIPTTNTFRTLMNIIDRDSIEVISKEYARLVKESIMHIKQEQVGFTLDRIEVTPEVFFANGTTVGDCFVSCPFPEYKEELLGRVVVAGAGYISSLKNEVVQLTNGHSIDAVFIRERLKEQHALYEIKKTSQVGDATVECTAQILPIVMFSEMNVDNESAKNVIRYERTINGGDSRVLYFITNFDYRIADDAEMLKFSLEHYWKEEGVDTIDFDFMVFDEYYDIKDYSLYIDEPWIVPNRQYWDATIFNIMTYARTALAREDEHRGKLKYKVMMERMDWDMPAAVRYLWMYWIDNGTDWSARPHNHTTFFSNKFAE